MLRVLPPTFNQVVAGREELLQKVESSSTFATAFVRVARFTGPRQTCFAASDVTPVYPCMAWLPRNFIQSEASIHTTCSNDNFLARQVWTWVVKGAKKPFNSFCSYVAKQAAHFLARFTAALRRLHGSQWTAPRSRVTPFPRRPAPCRLGTRQNYIKSAQITPPNIPTQQAIVFRQLRWLFYPAWL